MALNPGTLIDDLPKNPILDRTKITQTLGFDVNFPYIVSAGFHAGVIDKTRWQTTIDAYIGCGLNSVGFYAIEYDALGNKPKFFVGARNYSDSPDWGKIESGEFRIGDNVKEDNGSLVGSNYLWYTPSKGLELSGPLLTSLSSSVNIIQSPDFDNITEFEYTMTHSETGGFSDSACFIANSNSYLRAKGEKTIDGATIIKGSILHCTTSDFDGTISIIADMYSESGTLLDSSASVVSYYYTGWTTTKEFKRCNYVVRVDSEEAVTFKLKVDVADCTAGTVTFDNWSAFKVFQSGIDSSTLSETLLPIKKGVLIDKTGIRAYWGADGDPLEKTFELSAADGSTYFKGNMLVNGFVHSGKMFDVSNEETTDPNEIVYWNGCGINEYGTYGVKAEIDVNGDHVSSKAKFLVSAKSATWSNDYLWGTGFNQGEFRVGDDIARTSATTLRGDKYIWFDGSDFRLKGVDLELSSGNYIWVGDFPTYGCGLAEAGITCIVEDSGTSLPTFLLAGDTIINDGYWVDVKKGEFRIGSDVRSVATSDLVFTEGNLSLTGVLNLIATTDATTGIPTSYIGISNIDHSTATYISSDGMAFKANDKWQGLFLGEDHPWSSGSSGLFYVGTEYDYNGGGTPNLGTSHIYFNGTDLEIMIGGKLVLREGEVSYSDIGGTKPPIDADHTVDNIPADVLKDTSTLAWDKLDTIPTWVQNANVLWEDVKTVGTPMYLGSGTGTSSYGLFLSSDYLGYRTSGGTWTSALKNNGDFFLGGSSTTASGLKWDASTNTLYVNGAYFGTTGYFSNSLYVGHDNNGILLYGASSSAAYMQSNIIEDGNAWGDVGWKIENTGIAKFNTIRSVGSVITIEASLASAFLSTVGAGYPRSACGCYNDTSSPHLAYLLYQSASGGGSTDAGISVNESTASVGRGYTSNIEIFPASSGTIKIGAATTNTLSFFGGSGDTQQSATDLAGVIAALKAYGLLSA